MPKDVPAQLQHWPFDHRYARLPERFFARVLPTPVRKPELCALNRPLARSLGLELAGLDDETAAAIFAGNRVPGGAEPIAMAYAGHQFGHFVPQLGDGRAILLGELVGPDGRRRDLQLKGCGPTPFSRRGDGRAALGPVLREYVVSEAMHGLGIRTTRALAACLTGERVQRETALPGAVLARVARSHIRVGTFEWFAARQDGEGLRLLAEHAIARHYPDAANQAHPFRALFEAVTERQARLVASWMRVGFVHGVMNTDNCSIAGETIDYGPCAFLDGYDPDAVFSAIDRNGRYAFRSQPLLAQWNMARLAEAMLPLLGESVDDALAFASAAVAGFMPRFAAAYRDAMAPKLGLSPQDEGVDAMIAATLDLLAVGRTDYTLFFTALLAAARGDDAPARALFLADAERHAAWRARWQAACARSRIAPAERAACMARANPARIPRNHQIEAMIGAAVGSGDLAPFHRLNAAFAAPDDPAPAFADLSLAPAPHEQVTRTFCGT